MRNLQLCYKTVCFERKGKKIPNHCFYRIFMTLFFVEEAKGLNHCVYFFGIHRILVYGGTAVSVITLPSEMRYWVIKR